VDAILWIVAGLGVALSLLLLRQVMKLSAAVDQLRRDKYYIDSRLKRIPDEMRETVEPLRHQLAMVVEGVALSRDMVLNGRLFTDVSAEEARMAIQQDGAAASGKIIVLDVRTPREYAARHIPGARLVPFEELDTRYRSEVPMDAEKIFVYCMGGERSRSACDYLSRRGYPNLYNIREGIQGWQGPVEGDGDVRLVQIESLRSKTKGLE